MLTVPVSRTANVYLELGDGGEAEMADDGQLCDEGR